MPWQKTSVVVERMKFISALLEEPEESFKTICRRFGISRETGYKWRRRFEAGGPRALEDRAPIAQCHGNATQAETEDAIVALRKAYPTWGPKKLKEHLVRTEPALTLPALSTFGRILDRRGMIAPRRRRVRVPPSTTGLVAPEHANALWTTDHKGNFPLTGGQCYPLTLCDAFSRCLLKCEVLRSTSVAEARPHFEAAFREFGLPDRIRSDNGSPFASNALGGLSGLSLWWVKLGIGIERIEPGHPEQNGAHERMHRTLKAEAVQPPTGNFVEQQREFDRFRRYFNHVRPHEGIDLALPAERYETSWREYPSVLRSPEYGPDLEVVRVSDKGRCRWRAETFHVSSLFAGEPLGIREVADQRWTLHFGDLLLGGLERRSGVLEVVRDLEAFSAKLGFTVS